MDSFIELLDSDSGTGISIETTPERRATNQMDKLGDDDNSDNYEDEPDETLLERLWGLTEMFPEPVRNTCAAIADFSLSTTKTLFNFSCNASWIFFTSSMILFAPVIFETERAQMEEMRKSQQKQVLLGPGSAVSSSGLPALPPMAGR